MYGNISYCKSSYITFEYIFYYWHRREEEEDFGKT